MQKITRYNILMNLIFIAAFVWLNNWALAQQLEETFIALALLYGVIVFSANALYVEMTAKVR